jgi:AraC family multidrug resistance transcriptional activator
MSGMRRDHFSAGVINQILHWIDDHIHEKITLEDLSRIAGYSKWHLQRMFYDQMSVTAASYIRHDKLHRSIRDLKFGDCSIIEIAEKYSFSSQQSYTRTFKHVLTCTPSQCRARRNHLFNGLEGEALCKACHQLYD